MKGSGLLVLCLLAHTMCAAQDVLLAPAFDHTNFPGSTGYVDGSGACLGLRIQIANTYSTLELRPAYVRGTQPIRRSNYERQDTRAGVALGLVKSYDLQENFSLEYGVEAGYYMRWIEEDRLGPSSAQQRSVAFGGTIGIRATSLQSVQPFLSLHPFYEEMLKVWYTSGPERFFPWGSQFGISICVGLILGLPAKESAWE